MRVFFIPLDTSQMQRFETTPKANKLTIEGEIKKKK